MLTDPAYQFDGDGQSCPGCTATGTIATSGPLSRFFIDWERIRCDARCEPGKCGGSECASGLGSGFSWQESAAACCAQSIINSGNMCDSTSDCGEGIGSCVMPLPPAASTFCHDAMAARTRVPLEGTSELDGLPMGGCYSVTDQTTCQQSKTVQMRDYKPASSCCDPVTKVCSGCPAAKIRNGDIVSAGEVIQCYWDLGGQRCFGSRTNCREDTSVAPSLAAAAQLGGSRASSGSMTVVAGVAAGGVLLSVGLVTTRRRFVAGKARKGADTADTAQVRGPADLGSAPTSDATLVSSYV